MNFNKVLLAATGFLLAASVASAFAEEPPPVVTMRLVRPDEQLERVLDLFKKAPASDPAAALAAWKQANKGEKNIGKALEAFIAVFNHAMLPELRVFHDAEVLLGFEAASGKLRWQSIVPHDDGTVSALTEALALTDGASEAPLGSIGVLRLGSPGSAVSARGTHGLVLASHRVELLQAIERTPDPHPGPQGWHARLNPAGLGPLRSLDARRLQHALEAVGCRQSDAFACFEGQTLSVKLTTQHAETKQPRPAIDPEWLNLIPASGTIAAFSLAIDPEARSLDAAFAFLDRVEKADPARAGVAPLRVRLNLLAAAARVQPEVDLWPELRGVTVALLATERGTIDGAIVALHTASSDSAIKITEKVLPRLASTYIKENKPAEIAREDVRSLGVFDGKPLHVLARKKSAIIGWGEHGLTKAIETLDHPVRSAAASIRAGWDQNPPERAGALWLGQVRNVETLSPALANALAKASPIVWSGSTKGGLSLDIARWNQLDSMITDWLEKLPFEPPPFR